MDDRAGYQEPRDLAEPQPAEGEALIGCQHEWCMTSISTTAGDRRGIRCTKCGVTRDIDKRPSPTQGDEGALRADLEGTLLRTNDGPLRDLLLRLRAALTRPTPPDRGDEAAFEAWWATKWETAPFIPQPREIVREAWTAAFLAARSPSGEAG